MDLEEIHTLLKAASRSENANYATVKEWFTKCGIIDGRFISEAAFDEAYQRLNPNKEDIGMAKFMQLLGILARNAKQDVTALVAKFHTVKQSLIDEIKKEPAE